MSVALLDVNVLLALIVPGHVNHEAAHRWFKQKRLLGWATCGITQNGAVRILSNPSSPIETHTPAAVAALLRSMTDTPGHHFWAESISLLDDRRFDLVRMRGHQQITDTYLLGLAVHHGGRLATFDRAISHAAVRGANSSHLELLG